MGFIQNAEGGGGHKRESLRTNASERFYQRYLPKILNIQVCWEDKHTNISVIDVSNSNFIEVMIAC